MNTRLEGRLRKHTVRFISCPGTHEGMICGVRRLFSYLSHCPSKFVLSDILLSLDLTPPLLHLTFVSSSFLAWHSKLLTADFRLLYFQPPVPSGTYTHTRLHLVSLYLGCPGNAFTLFSPPGFLFFLSHLTNSTHSLRIKSKVISCIIKPFFPNVPLEGTSPPHTPLSHFIPFNPLAVYSFIPLTPPQAP